MRAILIASSVLALLVARQAWPARLALALGVMGFVGPSAGGQEFRINTKLFEGLGGEPVSESVTVFTEGRVYDFIHTAPQEIAVFDTATEVFTLLDPQRKTQTIIRGDDLARFVARLKARAAEASPLAAFAAAPQFHVAADGDENWLKLSSDLMIYECLTISAPDEDVSREFRRFCDWTARLNTTRPGALPPQARLELNSELAGRRLLPTQVKLTLVTRRGDPQRYRSESLFNWALLPADKENMRKANAMFETFQVVTLAEFRGLKQQTNSKPRR